MTGNFYGPASCGWGWGCGFRIEEISVRMCVCVCVERHLPATVAYSQVSVQSVVCMPTACRVLLVFFSLSFLLLFCQQSIWTIDVAISCAALQTTWSPPLHPHFFYSVSCPCAWPSAKCQVFYPSYGMCVCFSPFLAWNNSLMYVNFVAYLYQSCHVPCAFNRKCNPRSHARTDTLSRL